MTKQNSKSKASAELKRRKPVQCSAMVRATWEYSHYRATLKRNGRTFAIVTPDGKNALNPFDAFVLLTALNGGSNDPDQGRRANDSKTL